VNSNNNNSIHKKLPLQAGASRGSSSEEDNSNSRPVSRWSRRSRGKSDTEDTEAVLRNEGNDVCEERRSFGNGRGVRTRLLADAHGAGRVRRQLAAIESGLLSTAHRGFDQDHEADDDAVKGSGEPVSGTLLLLLALLLLLKCAQMPRTRT
jgi:hypothetical protein